MTRRGLGILGFSYNKEPLQYAPTYVILVHLLHVPREMFVQDRDYFALALYENTSPSTYMALGCISRVPVDIILLCSSPFLITIVKK